MKLWVFREQQHVGRIDSDDDNQMSFQYASSWVNDPTAFAISLSMPLDEDPYGPNRAHRFFANLLPEGPVRTLVSRRLGISLDNDVQLLAAIGGECAGALSVCTGPDPGGVEGSYRPLSPDAIARWARDGTAMTSAAGDGTVRLSLAGAQDKLPVYVGDGGALYLPESGAPSSHILKFPNRDFAHLPSNEVFLTALARRCGLPVVDTTLAVIGDVPVVLVKRYDRHEVDGTLRRAHQEDMCQALGKPRTLKYQADGGPGFVPIWEIVQRNVAAPLRDGPALLRWLAFCAAVGNADGHAKNLSFLYRRGIALAPFYDLVCTRAYASVERRLAFGVGGERDPGQIARRHWQEMARDLGLGERFVCDLVNDLVARVRAELDATVQTFRDQNGDRPILQMLPMIIARQARRSAQLWA